jgi:hypothetical protein
MLVEVLEELLGLQCTRGWGELLLFLRKRKSE